MTKAQSCYLLEQGDDPANASFCRSIGEAKEKYGDAARQLARFGQEHTASLHLVEAQGDDWSEYPDRILTLSRNGNVLVGNC